MVCTPVRSIIPSLSEGIIDRAGAQNMLYLSSTIISSVDLAHYGVFRAKDWVSVDCGRSCSSEICLIPTSPLSNSSHPDFLPSETKHLLHSSSE